MYCSEIFALCLVLSVFVLDVIYVCNFSLFYFSLKTLFFHGVHITSLVDFKFVFYVLTSPVFVFDYVNKIY